MVKTTNQWNMVEFTVNYEKNMLSDGDLSTKKMWFYSI